MQMLSLRVFIELFDRFNPLICRICSMKTVISAFEVEKPANKSQVFLKQGRIYFHQDIFMYNKMTGVASGLQDIRRILY